MFPSTYPFHPYQYFLHNHVRWFRSWWVLAEHLLSKPWEFSSKLWAQRAVATCRSICFRVPLSSLLHHGRWLRGWCAWGRAEGWRNCWWMFDLRMVGPSNKNRSVAIQLWHLRNLCWTTTGTWCHVMWQLATRPWATKLAPKTWSSPANMVIPGKYPLHFFCNSYS